MYQSKKKGSVDWNLADPIYDGGPLDPAQLELFFRQREHWSKSDPIDVLSYRVARYHILDLLGKGMAAVQQNTDGSEVAAKVGGGFQKRIDSVSRQSEGGKEEIIAVIVDAIYAERKTPFRYSKVPQAQRYFARAAASKLSPMLSKFDIEFNHISFDETIDPSRTSTGKVHASGTRTNEDSIEDCSESEGIDRSSSAPPLYQRRWNSAPIHHKEVDYIDEICMRDLADWKAWRNQYMGKKRPPENCRFLVLLILRDETVDYDWAEIADAINDVHAGEQIVGLPVDWKSVEQSLFAMGWRNPNRVPITDENVRLHPHHCWPDIPHRRSYLPQQWLPLGRGRDNIHEWFPVGKAYTEESLRQLYSRGRTRMREEAQGNG